MAAKAEGGAARFVALLRGINVGKAKRIRMAELRALIEQLGFRDVRTLLNSGNVVFTAPGGTPAAAAARIEQALMRRLGVQARVTVLSAKELATAVAGNPLLAIARDPARLLVAVPASSADRARLASLLERAWEPETLALGPRVAYLWCSGGILESPLWEAVGRALRDAVTSRNWTTVLKLHALASADRASPGTAPGPPASRAAGAPASRAAGAPAPRAARASAARGAGRPKRRPSAAPGRRKPLARD